MADLNFPLQLQSVIFTNCSVFAIPGHTPNETGEKTNKGAINNLDVELLHEETLEFAVTMTSKFNIEKDPSEPYMIDMACIGVFKVINTELSREEVIKALTITGHSIVYGAIRESVLWISSRSIYGPFTLGISVLKNANNQVTENNQEKPQKVKANKKD